MLSRGSFSCEGEMPLTLPQLCQNYMSLCVPIGKMRLSTPPLNA
jgi:hypothetical protein